MSDHNTNLTIGQLFELNQGKNPTQIADTEARARKAARSLGLDYNKMTETPEQIVSVADEVNTQKRVNEVVASDPVLGKYALNPNQAAVSLDDFENLKDISDKVSLLGSSLNKPYEPVSYQYIQNVLSKGTSPEQKKRLKELGIYEDPQKQVKPNVNPNLLDTLSTSLVPQTSDQVFKEHYDRIKKTAGVMSAERFKKYYENQVYWMEHTATAEPTSPQEQGNRYVNAAIRAVAAIGQTEGAVISATTGNDNLLNLATRVKNKAAPSQEMTQALYQAQLAAQTNDAGVLGAAQELVSNANAGLVGEFLIEQAPPALVGYYAGAGAGGVLTNSLIRNTAKYAPMVMNLEKAAKLVRGVTTAGNVAQGALGAGTADALLSYGQNMAEAREKFLTRQEQIDYAAAKTWGSAKYSALGGALMPVTFGGPLRTVGGQAVIQSAAGMYSVKGAADAVGEKADPVEMALEGLLEVATAAPEVAITSAAKVKNQRTAQFALDQLRQDQQQDVVRSSTFAAVLNNLIDRNKESKTAQRDDSASQAFIKQAVEEHGAVEEVYIDGQTFNQLLRDRNIEPTDLFERAPSLQDQLGTAETFNGTVQIPVNEFVSAMSVVERPTDFVENVRSSPDMPTYREAQENLAKTTEQMQQEADTYMAEQARFESAEDAKELVATEVQNQLAKVGTFTAKYNRAAGELTSAFYSTLGDKLGISAKEAFDRYPIRIADAIDTNGKTFNQSVIDQTKTEAFKNWFGDSKTIDSEGRPQVRYHGTRDNWTQWDKDRAGGLIHTTDDMNIAEYYAQGAGGGRKRSDPVYQDHEGNVFEPDGNEYVNRKDGTRLSFRDIQEMMDYGDINPVYPDARIEAIYVKAENPLDLNTKAGLKVLAEIDADTRLGQGIVDQAKNGQFNWSSTKNEFNYKHWANDLVPKLKALGYDAIAFSDDGHQTLSVFDSEQIKSINNSGNFDANNPNIYKQANGGTRGSITFSTGQDGSTIVLSKNADFSTFVHELGHHFLEMNMQLALSPDAPAQVRADMETVMKWASPETTDLGEWDFFTDAEKTEVHEKFAETFEQYVFTGKAPSAALKQVFNRFRQFMIAVYRNIEKFMGINDRAELNADITGVMDRMLASSSAIAEAQAASNLEMLIHQDDAMRLGISPKDYDEMRQDHEIATELSINTLEQKSLRNMIWYQKQKSKYLKTLQKEADKKRATVREDMAKEIAQQPVYQAMAFLRQPLDQIEKRDSTKVEPERDNLFEAIAKFGGLDANEVESTWGIDEAAKTKSGVGNKPVVRSSKSKVKGLSIESMAEKLSEEGYLTLDEHGKFDTRELEDKFADQLRGINQYSNKVDPELLDYAQDMDLLQRYAEGRTTKGKLSLDWIEAKYGRDSNIYQSISKGAYGFAQRGGENPDVVAEMFGYESGDALIRDLLNSPSPKQKIDELTDARMAVQYSEFFDQQSIIEAVEAALHNDVRARMLSAEMAALNGLLGRKSALNEAAKTVAQDIVQRQKIKDIRPHVRAQDDARLGRMANEAFRKGETVEAARHKRNQLVQFYATKYSYDAKDQIQKHLDLVKKVFGNNEKLSKNRDFDFVTAARGILGKYDLGRESTNYEHQLELIRKYDPTTYAEIQNIGALPENQNYRELTLEQFNAVMAAVETLWHRSKENKIWHTTNEAFEREQVREELIQQTGGKKSVEKIQQTLLGRDKTAELKAKFMELGASAKRVDQVVTWLDGGASGKFRTYLINPMQDALAKYRIEKAKMLKDVVDIFEGFGKLDNSKIAAPELNNFTFVGKQSLLHAILHTGNMSNKERLVLGYGWGARLEDGSVDFSAWDQFFNRMITENVITKKDMDNIQKLWNLFDKYKEQAQITHKKINGRYFDELPRTPISTPFGEYEGGYVPAAYDRIRSNEQDRIQDKNLAENNLAALDIATTGANFTKSRADRYHDQLELDMSRLPSHLDKELRYIHLELQIRQIGRLLLNKDFRNEIERVLPFGVKQVFNPWLKAIANQTVDESSGISLLDNIFRTLRRNTGIAIMAGNLKNAVEQFTGFTQVAVAVPPKQLLKAQAHYFASVATREDMANNIMEMSDFMKTRFDRAADEYRYAVDEIVFQKGAIQTVKDFTMKHAYVLQTTIQRPMEMISWQAAFNHYTEQGMTQYDAVHAADAVIRQYMTDMSPEGISNLERGTPAKRMFLMFYNWFNMVWNTSMSEAKLALEASNGSWVQASPRLAYVALMMISIPSMLSELLGVIFAGGLKDEDDDDNKWDDLSAKLALSQLKMLAAFVPYAGNVVNAAISNTDDTIVNDRYTASPVFSMGESGLSLIQHARRALDEDKEVNQGKASKDLMNTATLVTGIPFAVLGKPSGYWLDVAQGKKDAPDSIYDATRGTVTGKHAPE
ncbi:ADP-ribosyltransferase-containing protein [Acinetobacter baumannii]|uniref:ADP-ribosyltransferase-containing protein n=1 Tax=Acinetobacter baumannii TaxID=470 RepID=UPI0037C191BE